MALLVVIIGLVVRNQVKVYRNRQIRAQEARQIRANEARQMRSNETLQMTADQARIIRTLFGMLQPVALSNCDLERFGEAQDGGYLMCGNLLRQVQSAYSYGIGGYDKWGCDISSTLNVRLHQYDCFNTTQPACPGGDTVFHAECVDGITRTEEGRFFDTITNQFTKNGDGAKRIAMKIDVEGAEWESFLSAPDGVFDQIDQMAVEFHWVQDEKYPAVVQRLKEFFHIAHIHFNNHTCAKGLEPFPAWAYEVLFVSKRLGVVDPSRAAGGLHPLDAPNNPSFADCQPKTH
jgi:hypothetical protein